MNLKQLEYFLKIVECSSITEAAQQLYVSQPALTKAITALEAEYSVKLLLRNNKGIKLTQKGEKFLYYAKNVVDAANVLDHNFFEKNVVEKSRLFLAAQQQDYLYDLLINMYNEHKQQKKHYVIIETDRCDVTEKVLSGEVNLGLLIRTRYDGASLPWMLHAENLDIHVLDKSQAYACVGENSEFFMAEKITSEELNSLPNLVLSSGGKGAQSLNFDTSYTTINKDNILFCNSLECCRRFLLNTNMSLYITKWVKDYFDTPQIKVLKIEMPSDNEKFMHELMIIKRKNSNLDETERGFIKNLANYFNLDASTIFKSDK